MSHAVEGEIDALSHTCSPFAHFAMIFSGLSAAAAADLRAGKANKKDLVVYFDDDEPLNLHIPMHRIPFRRNVVRYLIQTESIDEIRTSDE